MFFDDIKSLLLNFTKLNGKFIFIIRLFSLIVLIQVLIILVTSDDNIAEG